MINKTLLLGVFFSFNALSIDDGIVNHELHLNSAKNKIPLCGIITNLTYNLDSGHLVIVKEFNSLSYIVMVEYAGIKHRFSKENGNSNLIKLEFNFPNLSVEVVCIENRYFNQKLKKYLIHYLPSVSLHQNSDNNGVTLIEV